MNRTQAVQRRRTEILKELARLWELRRGSVVEQVYESVRKEGAKVRRGPYALRCCLYSARFEHFWEDAPS